MVEEVKIDDGGKRMNFDSGAVREPATGKGRFDLISPFATERLAKWYELGAGKYAPRNWEKGIPFSRCLDSALRHINKYQRGMKDEDHLSAAIWNLICLVHFEETGQDAELNDLPSYGAKEEERLKAEIELLKGKLRATETMGEMERVRDRLASTCPTGCCPIYNPYVQTWGVYGSQHT